MNLCYVFLSALLKLCLKDDITCKVTQGSDIKWHKALRHYGNVRAIAYSCFKVNNIIFIYFLSYDNKFFKPIDWLRDRGFRISLSAINIDTLKKFVGQETDKRKFKLKLTFIDFFILLSQLNDH